MIPLEKCKFACVFFPIDETFGIVGIEDTSFTQMHYDKILDGRDRNIVLDTFYNGETFDSTLVQLGSDSEDLEVTEERCIDLISKKKKKIVDILIRIPRFHSGKRMAYEPLSLINTSLSESESQAVKPTKRPRKMTEEPRKLQPPKCKDTEQLPPILAVDSTHTDATDSKFTSYVVKKMNIMTSSILSIHKKQDEILSNQKALSKFIAENFSRTETETNENEKILDCLPVCDVSQLQELNTRVLNKNSSIELVIEKLKMLNCYIFISFVAVSFCCAVDTVCSLTRRVLLFI